MCKSLGVSRSGYYKWLKRNKKSVDKKKLRLETEIKAAEKRSRCTFGAERLQKELASNDVNISIYKIRKIRKELGLRCIQKKKFKATTNSKHNLPVAENLLKQQFKADAPNKVWVSDITYIPTVEGWLYLAAHKDIYSGEIVGYAMGERMTKQLVIDSLIKSIKTKKPKAGLINHSDRGSQYCSLAYQNIIAKYWMKASMSAKGNCYDNAPMESFWGIIKQELIHHHKYHTRQEAVRAVSEYINIFYNRQRIQAKLGYLSPAAFLIRYYKTKFEKEKIAG